MGDEIEFDIFNLEKTPSPQKPESNVKQNLNECDDSEGYFIQVAGQVINGYTVISLLGKGVFSTVVKAELNGKCFAIKIIRNNALMQKAALKEIEILSKLKSRNIISLDCNFTHRNHVCLVFELMELNLRQVLNKFGKGVGLNIKAVQVYAKQLFVALAQLQEKNVVHADIKPDNIMISENKNLLKLCDFGSASIDESDITPYLVSRFYRAPEIIIGNKWNAKIDVWAAGCTLFELFTGKILFPGKTNNQMLKLMMDCLGKFPNKIIRNGQFFEKHFDNGFNFLYHYESNGETIVKAVAVPAGKSNLKSIVLAGVAEEVVALVTMFADFLERTLMLNPEKRIKPTEALQHPFLTI